MMRGDEPGIPEAVARLARLRAAMTRRAATLGAAGAGAAAFGLHAADDARAADARERAVLRQGATLPAGLTMPAALDGVTLDPAAGLGLGLAPHTAWIIPRAGLLGPDGDPSPLREDRLAAGAIVTCFGEVWWLESVPAGENGFTLTAWAEGADGPEAMLAGEGRIGPAGLRVRLDTPASLQDSTRHDQIAARLTVGDDGDWGGSVEVRDHYGKGPRKCHNKCHDKEGEEHQRCVDQCHRRKKRRRKHQRR